MNLWLICDVGYLLSVSVFCRIVCLYVCLLAILLYLCSADKRCFAK